jgi:hypothetical protein
MMTIDTLLRLGEKTPNGDENWTKDRYQLAALRQCQFHTTLRSRCLGLNSRSRCPDPSLPSGELSKYPMYLLVRCGDSGSPFVWQVGGHSDPEKDSFYETLLL